MTVELIDELAAAVGDGLPDKYASALVGISDRTLKRWRADGAEAEPQSLLARLNRRLAEADAKFVLTHLRRIRDAGDPKTDMDAATRKNWTTSAWLLERRKDSPFRQQQQVELRPAPGGEDFNNLSDEQLVEQWAASQERLLALGLISPRAREPGAVATLPARRFAPGRERLAEEG